jgi:hypothetical protein
MMQTSLIKIDFPQYLHSLITSFREAQTWQLVHMENTIPSVLVWCSNTTSDHQCRSNKVNRFSLVAKTHPTHSEFC